MTQRITPPNSNSDFEELVKSVQALERLVAGGVSRLDAFGLRAGFQITGGGTLDWTGSAFKWSSRFIVISQGVDPNITINYFNIDTPSVGTIIQGVGSAPNVTVDANGRIPLSAWTALYYILPIGQAIGSLPGNFRVASYGGTPYVIPKHWIRIAMHHGDDTTLHVAGRGVIDFLRDVAFQNGWQNFGAGEPTAQYYKENGRVWLSGSVKLGAVATAMFVLPTGYTPPLDTVRFPVIDGTGNPTGTVIVFASGAVNLQVGNNAYVSLAPVNFKAA